MSAVGHATHRLHTLLLVTIALAGLVIIGLVAAQMVLAADQQARDMGLLGLVFTTPVWVAGLAAAVTLILVRGRSASAVRVAVWAVGATVIAVGMSAITGSVGFAAALLTQPGLVSLDWPVAVVSTADGSGASYYYLDSPAVWLPIVVIVLGVASTAALILERRTSRRERAQQGS